MNSYINIIIQNMKCRYSARIEYFYQSSTKFENTKMVYPENKEFYGNASKSFTNTSIFNTLVINILFFFSKVILFH